MAGLGHGRDSPFDDTMGGETDQLVATKADRAAGGPQQARDGIEQRGLTRAIRTKDRLDLALMDVDRDVVQRAMPAVGMVEAVDLKHPHHRDKHG
jgi:hypothetical protein